MTTNINDVRKALSSDFDNLAGCLLPMGYAHTVPWSNEEDYLNNLYFATQWSKQLSSKLVLSTPKSNYSLRIDCEKVHKRILVEFPFKRKLQSCEIGDILIVSKYVDPHGILSRNVCFIQVKVSDKKKRFDVWKIDEKQLYFYSKWPIINNCYTGRGSNRHILLKNLKISHRNRLFSSYLLLGRSRHPGLSYGPYPWITGTDLVATASNRNGKMQGPLEVAFLYHLIQLIFQVNGERDISKYKSNNSNLTQLVNRLLKYVNLNDPPEGEGRPFVAITLTLKIPEAQ